MEDGLKELHKLSIKFWLFKMTSVERIIEYTQISSEHSLKSNKKSPTNWPMKGQIVFKNVSLKYDPNLPEVIKDISLSINPSQKIGFDF